MHPGRYCAANQAATKSKNFKSSALGKKSNSDNKLTSHAKMSSQKKAIQQDIDQSEL